MKKKLLFLVLICLQFSAFGQEDAWVFFNSKANVSQALANPISILTQKSLDRKALHGVVIDYRDVPVDENYVTQLKNSTGITVYAKSKWMNAVHVRGSEADINALAGLSFVDHIEFADRSLNGSRQITPLTDKFEMENRIEFTYGDTQNQVEMLNLQHLHEQDYTGDGLTIAVMDSGFPNVNTMAAFQRLRDAGNLLDGYDFVDRTNDVYAFSGNEHGTRVLSTMAAFIQDDFVGTAPDAKYYLFRTEDVFSENPVEESYWVEAAERADSLGVDIINTSLGYKSYDNPDYSYSSEDMNGLTAFISRGANIAFEKGLLLINSAGNSGASGVNAPADAAGVFSIGAVDSNGNYASFSSQGSLFQPTHKPDVMAKGQGSAVVTSSGFISFNNGTSFSSPILAGAAACLWQVLPEMTNAEIMNVIRESSSQYATPDYLMGHGIPDFQSALLILLEIQESMQSEFRFFPNPVDTELNLLLPADYLGSEIQIFDILGKHVFSQRLNSVHMTVDMQSLASGIYLAKVGGDQIDSQSFKLLKN